MTFDDHLIPKTALSDYYYTHFTDWETDACGSFMICLMSHSSKVRIQAPGV